MPEFQQFFTDADRQRAYADMLMGRSMQSRAPQQTGRIVPKMGFGEGMAQLGEAFLARRAGKKAGELQTKGEDAKRDAMVAALSGMGGQDTMMASTEGGAAPDMNPYQRAQQALESGVNPAVVGQWLQTQQPQQPESTDDITEYERARAQGYQGTFEEFLFDPRRRSGTTVNLRNEGTIPTGYRAERDEQGNILRYVPVEGGPAAQEAAEAAEAAENRQADKERQGDFVTQEIDRALQTLESPSLPETGLVGNLLKGVPGTDSHAVQNFITTIKSNVGFDKLQAMRDASPTGGALGQVSEMEILLLQSVLGSLEQSQRKEDLVYNLNRLWNTYQDIVHGEGGGPERRPLTPPQGEQAPQMAADDPLSTLTPEQREKYGL